MFVVREPGIPIHIIRQSQLKSWLKKQPASVLNWLQSQQVDGPGHSLIPGPDGEVSAVLLIVESKDRFYILGDLAKSLPIATYEVKGDSDLAERAAICWGLSLYRFNKIGNQKSRDLPTLSLPSKSMYKRVHNTIKSTNLVRDLVNTPANLMMPEHLSQACQTLASEFKARFNEVVDEELLEQNYPMIHAVGRASDNRPRLLDLRWGNPDAPKITLVGKGICFDSGGLDLKPGAGMRLMKKDMGGAAHVLGLASLIMGHKLPINLRVLIPAAENAVSANAFRPGDVVPTRAGLQVEIDNTDAEGRLVLCDALTEADSESPDLIIDFATLTGACRVALGTELPGFFTQYNDLARQLVDIGERISDPVWQLPLHKPYRSMLDSQTADLLNSAASGLGGAITAALYLGEFVSDSTPWIHFDVMAWNTRHLPCRPVGGEAFGIRTVFEYLKQTYAK